MGSVDVYLRCCLGCSLRKPVRYMERIAEKYPYCPECARIIHGIFKSADQEPRKRKGAVIDEAAKPKNVIKWWDAKAREWRWVSKKSKPKLRAP